MVMIVRPESTTKRHGIHLYASGVALLCFCSHAFAQSEAPAEQPADHSAAAEAQQSDSLGAGEIIVHARQPDEYITKVGLPSATAIGREPARDRVLPVVSISQEAC